MNNRNVKVIDEHNIDRNANIMFAVDLNGSEYVVYWIERDETSNNVFVSKVLKNLDGTYNMLNIDDDDKKREVSETVKFLISSSVSDQNDKLVGVTKTLANGQVAKFIAVSFNKEQNINVPKTYITTVKKEVTKVVEDYYDVVSSETNIKTVLTPVVNEEKTVVQSTPVLPEIEEVITKVETTPVETPVVAPVIPEVTHESVVVTPVVQATSVTPEPIVAPVVEQVLAPVDPPVFTVMDNPVVDMPKVESPVVSVETEQILTVPTPVENIIPAVTPEVTQDPVVVAPMGQTTQVNSESVVVTPVLEQQVPVNNISVPTFVTAPTEVQAVPGAPVVNVTIPQNNEIKADVVVPVTPTPVVTEPIVNNSDVSTNSALVFNAAKETNLNAALGEVANSSTIPVQNINVVREFGEEAPVTQEVMQPTIAPMVQSNNGAEPKMLVKKAGFANSKFFMVVAIAFFMASCIFLGYEVYNYFQITK